MLLVCVKDLCPMITSQDDPVAASVETLEMNIRKFDADWKTNGFSIPHADGKFPRSKVHLSNGIIEKYLDKDICLAMGSFSTDIITPSSEKFDPMKNITKLLR